MTQEHIAASETVDTTPATPTQATHTLSEARATIHEATATVFCDAKGNVISAERARDLRFQRIKQPDGSETNGLGEPIKTTFRF